MEDTPNPYQSFGSVKPASDPIGAAEDALDLTVVYAAATAVEAHLLKTELGEAGIKAVVTNSVLEGGAGVDILGWPTLARVAVAEKDAGEARQIALEFDKEISARSQGPKSETFVEEARPAEGQAVPSGRATWPRCPQCNALRITRCPVCRTTGTDFRRADPDFLDGLGLSEDAQPLSTCGCGSGSCGKKPSAAHEDQGAADAGGEEAPAELPAETAPPRLVLICRTCDEPFVPEFAAECPQCGHPFDEGFAVEEEEVETVQYDRRLIAGILVVVGLLAGLLIYFATISTGR